MIEYVYMISNGDLYNIGSTDNLSLIKKQLQPGVLIASLKTEDAKEIVEILGYEGREELIHKDDLVKYNLWLIKI